MTKKHAAVKQEEAEVTAQGGELEPIDTNQEPLAEEMAGEAEVSEEDPGNEPEVQEDTKDLGEAPILKNGESVTISKSRKYADQ